MSCHSSRGPMGRGSMAKCCAPTAALHEQYFHFCPTANSSTRREPIMKNIIVITGASSGFGALAARALASADHTVYASMRETAGRNAPQVKAVEQYVAEHGVDLRAIELDVSSQKSCDAAKAGMDALAVVYARELTRWGIESSIIVPGAFTGGTNHFAHAGSPADKARAAEYEAGPYAGFADQVLKGFTSIVPPDADVSAVADAIVKVVDTPFGKRPFRVHIDPTQDGAEVVNGVMDRIRAELLRRIGLGELLKPRIVASLSHSAD